MIPSGPEAFIVLAVIILLFGAKKLPELAGSVGKSIKAFRKETDKPDDAPADADADSEA
jgi:sec-independent protein translocase protein TatA